MKNRTLLLALLLMGELCSASAWASQEENKLLAVFLGRFASYIEVPGRTTEQFIITVIDENPFGSLLDDLYRGKAIGGKPVLIRYATKVEEVGQSDILFIIDTFGKNHRL
jgi:hypothetical protein